MKIREAKPTDAIPLLRYLEKLLNEPDHNGPILKGEFKRTEAQQEDILKAFEVETNSVFFLAEEKGQIIGEINLRGNQRLALRHSVMLGMSVNSEQRGRGIGTKLLKHALDWAQKSTIIERIELIVLATNEHAIELYKRFGFIEEGRRQQAVKFGQSDYVDDIIMAKLVGEKQ